MTRQIMEKLTSSIQTQQSHCRYESLHIHWSPPFIVQTQHLASVKCSHSYQCTGLNTRPMKYIPAGAVNMKLSSGTNPPIHTCKNQNVALEDPNNCVRSLWLCHRSLPKVLLQCGKDDTPVLQSTTGSFFINGVKSTFSQDHSASSLSF